MIAPIVVPAKAPNRPRKLEAHSELPSSFALSPLKGGERLFQCDFAESDEYFLLRYLQ
jgi:hypothetical protein